MSERFCKECGRKHPPLYKTIPEECSVCGTVRFMNVRIASEPDPDYPLRCVEVQGMGDQWVRWRYGVFYSAGEAIVEYDKACGTGTFTKNDRLGTVRVTPCRIVIKPEKWQPGLGHKR